MEDKCRGTWVCVRKSCVKARGRGICCMVGEMSVCEVWSCAVVRTLEEKNRNGELYVG